MPPWYCRCGLLDGQAMQWKGGVIPSKPLGVSSLDLDGMQSDLPCMDELRSLARVRLLSDFRSSVFPGLRPCERQEHVLDKGNERLRQDIESSIAAIPDHQYRDAAYALLGFHDQRWAPLKTRQADAARAFGVGFEGFRRRRSGGRPSLYDETLREVARSLRASATMARALPPEGHSDSTKSAESEEDHSIDESPTDPTADNDPPIRLGDAQPDSDSASPPEHPTPDPPTSTTSVATPPTSAEPPPLPRPTDPSPQTEGTTVRRFGVVAASALLGAFVGIVTWSAVVTDDGPQVVGGMDLDLYCSRTVGPDSTARQVATDASGWRCVDGSGELLAVDFGHACAELYGANVQAQLADWNDALSWRCAATDDGGWLPTISGGCVFEAGESVDTADQDLTRYSGLFRATYERGGGHEDLGCPSGPLLRRGDGVVQALSTDGQSSGAIYATADDGAVLLTGPAWDAYERFGGGQGASAYLMGLPQHAPEQQSGAWVVEGTNGGALVADDPAGPYFLLPQPSLTAWQQTGGSKGELGLPVSDFYGADDGVQQDFTNGTIRIDGDGLHVTANR